MTLDRETSDDETMEGLTWENESGERVKLS